MVVEPVLVPQISLRPHGSGWLFRPGSKPASHQADGVTAPAQQDDEGNAQVQRR